MERYEKMRAVRLAKVKKIKCRNCGKKFAPIPFTRINCSRKCSKAYRPPREKRKPRSKNLNPATLFSGFAFGVNLDSAEKKAAHRQEVVFAMKDFFDRGGKIEVSAPLPFPKIPSVGSTEWSWEMRAGVGPFYGSQEIVEPDYILDEIISNKK